MNYENYIRKNLLKKGFDEDQIKIVLNLVLELLPHEKDDSLSLIKYANRKFEARYGTEDIFCYFPVSPQIMKYVNDFKLSNKLKGDKYREYIDWLMINGEDKLHRVPQIKDLYNWKVFCIFNKKGDTKKLEDRKRVMNKNLLII